MIKNWKSLFIKTEDNADANSSDNMSFPVNNAGNRSMPANDSVLPAQPPPPPAIPGLAEVVSVYEAGLESINMPGYDFYEFYKAVNSTGNLGAQAYQMAYSMAKAFDSTITVQKLVKDADFYIIKINEVHSQYTSQGQQKLNSLQEQKQSQKTKLQAEIDTASARIAQLRVELQQLEASINQNRDTLAKIDQNVFPQEKAIRDKLTANDMARNVSIEKLTSVKENILKFIKG